MKPIAIRSNKTRAEERPPLNVRQADAALLARFGFSKPQPATRPSHVKKPAQGKKESRLAVPPAARPVPPAQKPFAPQNRPAAPPPQGQAQAQPQPKAQPPRPEPRRFTPQNPPQGRPQTPPQKFSQKPPPAGPQAQKPALPPSGPADRGQGPKPPAQNPPDRKTPPAPENPPAYRGYSRPQQPPGPKPPDNPTSGSKPMGPNTPPVNGKPAQPPANNRVNGAPVNGKHHPTEQAPRPSGPPKPIQDPRVARGQEDQNDSHVPGSPQPEENKPVEKRLNGSPPDGSRLGNKTPGSNGTNGNGNGSGHRSSLFRPGAFASMPILRIPPSEDAPTGRPAMQIPMDVYVRPDGEGAPRANSPARDEKPQVVVPSLDQVLQQNPNLPPQAAVLGVCEDGLPVLLDMDDPTPGALVVIGDEREAQLEVLRTAIASLVKRSSPRSVQFLVFSCEPETWQDWISAQGYDRYSLGVERAESESIRDWVIRLADWTEQRRLGQSSGPSVLLVMDTLSFLTTLDYDIRLNFEWMAKEGPQAHVWPLAVVSTDLAKTLRGRRLLRAFQTQVLGYAHNTEDYVPLAGLDPKEAGAFRARGEFAVKAGENWLRFRLPRR